MVEPADQLEVLPAGQQLVDCGKLTGQADDRAQRGGIGHHVVTRHPGPAGVRPEQRGQNAHQRGLARTVGAE
jgi:hypothetical protein